MTALHALHRPTASTAVVAVLDRDERVCASASFARGTASADGWVHRNALLAQLRRVVPHDLRRRSPQGRRCCCTAVTGRGAGPRRTAPGCGGCGTRARCTACAAGPTSR
ncbi:hypothetical protein ACFQVA_32660 [Actinomadura keratinilytica]